jgi:hypothetical protein
VFVESTVPSVSVFNMAASFQLPTAAPPGNVFPAPKPVDGLQRGLSPVYEAPTPTSAGGGGSGLQMTVLKPDTRPVLVEITETTTDHGPTTPDPADFPPPPAKVQLKDATRPTTPKRHALPQLTIHTGATRTSPSRTDSRSPTLVRNNSDASQEVEQTEPTPIMRSMFPRLGGPVPVQPQHQAPHHRRYDQPTQAIPPPPAGPPPGHYSPSLYSEPATSPPAQTQRNAYASRTAMATGSSPLRIAEEPPPDLASGEELLDLWTVANGQESHEAKDRYTLGLSWYISRF